MQFTKSKRYLYKTPIKTTQIRHKPYQLVHKNINQLIYNNQVIIAQWLAWWLATGKVQDSNPGQGENFLISDEKGNLIIQI